MRLTIRKRKRHKKRQKNSKAIGVFIVAPLISIILGWSITKKVIIPYLEKDSLAIENKLQNESTKAKGLKQLNLYNIELARFDKLEDSEAFLKEVNEGNVFAYVSKLDNYVIYTSLSFEKKIAEDNLIKIRENYPDAKINSINIEAKKLNVDQSEENILKEIKNSVNVLNNSYKEEMRLFARDITDIDFNEVKNKINNNNKKLVKQINNYSDIFLSQEVESQELRTLYLILSQNIESREKIVNEFNTDNVEYVKKTYYDFIKTLFTYINYYNM